MNIQNLVKQISEQIKSEENSWWLLEAITNKTKSQLLSNDIILTQELLQKIDKWIHKIILEVKHNKLFVN